MNKLDMAHQYALRLPPALNRNELKTVVSLSWRYADLMQAEADKREQSEAKEKREKVRALLNDENTFLEREGQHFDEVLQPEVDWRLAPKGAYKYKTSNDKAVWFVRDGIYAREVLAPSFGFTDSHVVERPQ